MTGDDAIHGERSMQTDNINRKAAQEQAEEEGFDPSKMLYCTECGRTVLRSQKPGNPGFKDKIYCTCDEVRYPMVPLEDDNE